MSLKIIKAGLLDTVQDLGRYGYQHLGINPSGAMDRFSASLANALLGKDLHAPVIEMHFPAAQILFQQPSVICISGGDFTPTINNIPAPLHQPILISANAVLQFKTLKGGARCYLSFLNEMHVTKWLNSYSTNLKAGAGGFNGRRFQKGDELGFDPMQLPEVNTNRFTSLPWRYKNETIITNEVEFLPGKEWNWMSAKGQARLLNNLFALTATSDRMGYRLHGETLEQQQHEQLVSSAVSFGTIQLLPNGQLLVLIADHQTTGGYPRIGHVISAHLPKLAQMKPNEEIRFVMTDVNSAEKKLVEQQNYLHRLQKTCHLKMQAYVNLPSRRM